MLRAFEDLTRPVLGSLLAVKGHNPLQGARMGDKGGKKDKEKIKQQQLKKQKQEEHRKEDKARPRTQGGS